MGKLKNAPAVRGKHEVAVAGYEQYAGAGSEGLTTQDLAVPRLYMLHTLSPQVNKKDPKHIPGAEAGMIYNTVTQEVYKGLWLVACGYRRSFSEWVDRKEGGGFVAEHFEQDPKWVKEDKGPWVLEKKSTADHKRHVINDTRTFAVYASKTEAMDEPFNALVSLTSSQLRRAANWLTVATSKSFKSGSGKVGRLPIFASRFHAEGEYQENDQGSWYAWKITDTQELNPADGDLFQACAAFHEMFKGGRIAAAAPPEQEGKEDSGRM